MLSRWFKRSNRLEHPHSEVRLHAVQALNAEQAAQQQAVLERIVLQDDDLEVRRAALERILNPNVLVELLDENEFADEVAQQIAQRIKAGQTAPCRDHERVLAARIAIADDSDLDALWPSLTSAEHCAELALRLRDEGRQRVLGHAVLNTEQGLAVLQRIARGHDKSIHRYARQRLEAIKASHAQCVEATSRLAELDAAIEKSLKAHPADAAAVISHRQKLKKLGDMRGSVVEELRAAVSALENGGGNSETVTIPPDPLARVDLTLPDPDNNPFKQMVAGFQTLRTAMQDGAPLQQVAQQRDALTAQWLSESDKFPPTPAQHEVFEKVAHQFHEYRDAWQRLASIEQWQTECPDSVAQDIVVDSATRRALERHQRWRKRWQKKISTIDWPPGHTPPPLLSMAQSTLNRIDDDIERLHAALTAAAEELEETVGEAADALDAGKLDRAKRHLRHARNLQKAGLQAREREIAALSARVAEFEDWRHFATDPKRHELLSELQSLCDQPAEPPEQAAKLKSLRRGWQQLGPPTSAEDAALQQEFDRLADLAFAPCRTYYDERAKLRAANLAQREALCDQLQTYLTGTDWADADMQAAETILRSAREEWHKYHPCERKALRPVQQRFEGLQDELHGKVKAAWNENLAHKQSIVEQAKALLSEDTDTQVEGAKRLQHAWRRVGKTPRGPDQKLWREFRQICDQIFHARDAVQQAQQEALAQAHVRLEQAIAALAEAASAGDVSRKAFDALCAEIDRAAEGLPVDGKQRHRINKAQDVYRDALQAAKQVQAEAELVTWRTWDEAVSQAELDDQTIAAPHPVFTARIARDAKPADWLNLVLEAEIAAELPSPAQDQTARMALQVEFMNAGRRDLGAEDYRDLLQRWCEAGPKREVDPALRERFFHALAKRLQ